MRLDSLLIFLFGIGIYATTTVLPLFYQELLGYTAFTAGIAVAPRGVGAICGMPVIGYLSNKVDPRWLLSFGFMLFGLTTLLLWKRYVGYLAHYVAAANFVDRICA